MQHMHRKLQRLRHYGNIRTSESNRCTTDASYARVSLLQRSNSSRGYQSGQVRFSYRIQKHFGAKKKTDSDLFFLWSDFKVSFFFSIDSQRMSVFGVFFRDLPYLLRKKPILLKTLFVVILWFYWKLRLSLNLKRKRTCPSVFTTHSNVLMQQNHRFLAKF